MRFIRIWLHPVIDAFIDRHNEKPKPIDEPNPPTRSFVSQTLLPKTQPTLCSEL